MSLFKRPVEIRAGAAIKNDHLDLAGFEGRLACEFPRVINNAPRTRSLRLARILVRNRE